MEEPVIGVFIETATAGEDNESNFSITKNREFISFFQKSISSLTECNLSICCVLYSLYLYLSSPHYLYDLPIKILLLNSSSSSASS